VKGKIEIERELHGAHKKNMKRYLKDNIFDSFLIVKD